MGDVLAWFGTNWALNTAAIWSAPMDPMSWLGYLLRLMVVVCAVWRLSTMLVFEAGPFDVLSRIRKLRGIDESGIIVSGPNTAWMCDKCMSVWLALWLLFLPWEISVVFAVSGLALKFGGKW